MIQTPRIKLKPSLRNHSVSFTEKKTLQEAFDEFLMVKDLEGLRERTIKDHKDHFKYFLQFLERSDITIHFIDEVTPQICRGYVAFMKNKKHKWDNHEVLADVDPVKG